MLFSSLEDFDFLPSCVDVNMLHDTCIMHQYKAVRILASSNTPPMFLVAVKADMMLLTSCMYIIQCLFMVCDK